MGADEVTTYYHLAGTLTKEVDGVTTTITDRDEISAFVLHWMEMTRQYTKDGFRFVDADGHSTTSEGFVSLNWSDYGLPPQ